MEWKSKPISSKQYELIYHRLNQVLHPCLSRLLFYDTEEWKIVSPQCRELNQGQASKLIKELTRRKIHGQSIDRNELINIRDMIDE